MDTRHLVDPQLLPMIEGVPPLDLSAETLSATRAAPAPRHSYRQT